MTAKGTISESFTSLDPHRGTEAAWTNRFADNIMALLPISMEMDITAEGAHIFDDDLMSRLDKDARIQLQTHVRQLHRLYWSHYEEKVREPILRRNNNTAVVQSKPTNADAHNAQNTQNTASMDFSSS